MHPTFIALSEAEIQSNNQVSGIAPTPFRKAPTFSLSRFEGCFFLQFLLMPKTFVWQWPLASISLKYSSGSYNLQSVGSFLRKALSYGWSFEENWVAQICIRRSRNQSSEKFSSGKSFPFPENWNQEVPQLQMILLPLWWAVTRNRFAKLRGDENVIMNTLVSGVCLRGQTCFIIDTREISAFDVTCFMTSENPVSPCFTSS